MKPVLLRATLIGSAIVVATATLPLAGGHSPVEKREAAMKQVGKSTKLLGEMVATTVAGDRRAGDAGRGARDGQAGWGQGCAELEGDGPGGV